MGERPIKVLEGLEAIRARPAMYVGPEQAGVPRCAQLAELVLDAFAGVTPRPREVRLVAWRDRAITIAIDGFVLPVAPVVRRGVSHPALYGVFTVLFGDPHDATAGATIVNALSERLVVWTIHEGDTYRAAFSRGGIVTLLACLEHPPPPLGSTWLTFVPDGALMSGQIDAALGASIAERAAAKQGVRVVFEDRLSDDAEWF